MHLFVHAHPDDETLATGAAILALTRAGQPCARWGIAGMRTERAW